MFVATEAFLRKAPMPIGGSWTVFAASLAATNGRGPKV
jgi:hypothetical protein